MLLCVMMIAFCVDVFIPLNAFIMFQILVRGVYLLKVLANSSKDVLFASFDI